MREFKVYSEDDEEILIREFRKIKDRDTLSGGSDSAYGLPRFVTKDGEAINLIQGYGYQIVGKNTIFYER